MVARSCSAVLCAFLLACGGAGSTGAGSAAQTSAQSPLLDAPLPDFKRPTLGGDVFDTKALRSRVVVVKFFAKYCEPCKKTLPAIQKLHERHSETAFVGVALDESEGDARELVGLYGLTFPVVLDREHVLAGRFRVLDLPVTFVVDKSGVVRWVGGPQHDPNDLVRAIESFDR